MTAIPDSSAAALQVSVVTPFFNSQEGLERCIRSVLEQTGASFEYILADNRSTDASGEIARRYAATDARIRYVHFDEHLPQRANYNRALRLISTASRYCKMVQADDFIYPGCLREMVALAERNPQVGVIGALRSAGDTVSPQGAERLASVTNGVEMCRRVLRDEIYPFGSPTTLMFRSDLVRNRPVFFNEDMFFCDVDAVLEALRESDFGFCHELLTHTERDPTSTFGRIVPYGPTLLDRYTQLRLRGTQFFSDREAAALRSQVTREYYEWLTYALRRPDRRPLLKFHRQVLRGAGLGWEWSAGAAACWRVLQRKFSRRSLATQ